MWPLAVVGLLLSSVVTMTAFVMVSKSDGGPKVVDSYYQKAVQWDSLNAVQGAIKARNWTPQLSIKDSVGTFILLDSEQARIPFLTGTVSLSRPHTSELISGLPLSFVPSDSSYTFVQEATDAGLWDFTFSIRTGDTDLEVTIRKDL